MAWLKLTQQALYLMQSGENCFVDKTDTFTDPNSNPDELRLMIPRAWFTADTVPSGMIISLAGSDPDACLTPNVTITSPQHDSILDFENPFTIQGTAEGGIAYVRVSSPIGNQDFPLGTTPVREGQWRLTYQFTQPGDRLVVATGLNELLQDVALAQIGVSFQSMADKPSDLVTITSPGPGATVDLEQPVQFKGTVSGAVTQVRLRTPFAGYTFALGDALIKDNTWSLATPFTTGGDRKVIADGIGANGAVIDSAVVSFQLVSGDVNDLLRVRGASSTTKAFRQKVIAVAQRLDADPLYLMAVMSFESAETFSPAIKNFAGSGATGLIQFLPSTAIGLGTTVDKLAQMTALEQLDWVEKYFKQFRGPFRTLEDTYMAVLFPRAIRKGSNYVLFERPSREYEQNKGLDLNGNGQVTVGEATSKPRAKIV